MSSIFSQSQPLAATSTIDVQRIELLNESGEDPLKYILSTNVAEDGALTRKEPGYDQDDHQRCFGLLKPLDRLVDSGTV